MSHSEEDIISCVFALSCRRDGPKKIPGMESRTKESNVYFLSDFSEINHSLDFNTIDLALMERLGVNRILRKDEKLIENYIPTDKDYFIWLLFRSYERAKQLKFLSESPKFSIPQGYADKCIDICVSFSICLLTEPMAFNFSEITKYLFDLIVSESGNNVLITFICQILESIEQTQKNNIFLPVISECMDSLRNVGIKMTDGEYADAIHLLDFFVLTPPLTEVLLLSEYWLPNLNFKMPGKFIESFTFLGLLLSASPIHEISDPPIFFQNIRDYDEMNASMTNLRQHLRNLTANIVASLKQILLNKTLRNRLYAWIVSAIRSNEDHSKIGAMYQDVRKLLSSDGFFINFTLVMLQLLQPIVKNWGQKFDKISFNFLKCTIRINHSPDAAPMMFDFKDETKLIPSENPLSYEVMDIECFNFVTICYFLTPKVIRIALVPIWENYRKAMIMLHEGSQINPFMPSNDPEIIQLQNLFRWHISYKTHLCTPELTELLFDSIGAYSAHLLSLVGCNIFDGFHKLIQADFKASEVLQYIPELFIENIPANSLSLIEFTKDWSLDIHCTFTALVCFCSIYMGSGNFVRNPHLRAKLVECLGYMCDFEKQMETRFSSSFSINMYSYIKAVPFLPKVLVEHLLQVFIDIEFTGESNAFYQKFTYRRTMYMLLEYLWDVQEINKIFQQLSSEILMTGVHTHIPIFLKFINLLVNDANFLLDEALRLLPEIQSMEREMDNVTVWNNLPSDIKKQKEEKYEKDRKAATSYNILSLQTVQIINMITTTIKQIFVWNLLQDRMAAMLNFFLCNLVGDKKNELKVKNMSELKFEPKQLLKTICLIYCNLSEEEGFASALVRDERSFNLSLFDSAVAVLEQIGCPSNVIVAMIKLKKKTAFILSSKKTDGSGTDHPEIPDEFIDPISYTMMEDPVILPTSNTTLDRSTITHHLLSVEKDPFNRMPLKLDMLISDEELKKKIQIWKEVNFKKD